MSCRRCAEIDLELYLVDPQAPEWQELRSHFPDCADCTAALERATAFEEALSDALGGGHPTPEAIFDWKRSPSALAPEERQALERHLYSCRVCADALAALADFDFAALAADAPAPVREPVPSRGGLLGWLADLTRGLPGGVPGLAAVTALVLVGIWALVSRPPAPSDAPRPQLAERGPELRRPERPPEPALPDPEPRPAPSGLALETTPPPAEPVEELAAPEPEREAPQLALEPEPMPAPEAPAAGGSEPEAIPDDATDTWVLAMAELPAPRFATPFDALPGERVLEVYRGAGAGRPQLVALAPEDHAGRTRRAAPTLYWFAPEPSELELSFVLLDAEDEPLLELALGPLREAGIQGVALERHGVEIEPGSAHRWFVSLAPAGSPEQRRVLAGGELQRVAPAPPLQEPATAQSLAERGLWYDALAALGRAIERSDDPRLRRQRAELLEQGGLPEVAAFERGAAER